MNHLLGRALPEVTPLPAIDTARLVAQGRRTMLRRRLSFLVVGVAVVVVLAVSFAFVPPGQFRLVTPAVSSTSATASPTPTHPGPRLTVSPTPSISPPPSYPDGTPATAARLTAALRPAMHAALPGATFASHPSLGWPALELRVEQTSYFSRTRIVDQQGVGSVEIIIAPGNENYAECSPPGVTGGEVSCEEGTGPAGEKWMFDVMNDRDNGRPLLIYYTFILAKSDGTVIQFNVENTATTLKSQTATVSRPTPPMTKEQMLAVALDQGLTIRA